MTSLYLWRMQDVNNSSELARSNTKFLYHCYKLSLYHLTFFGRFRTWYSWSQKVLLITTGLGVDAETAPSEHRQEYG